MAIRRTRPEGRRGFAARRGGSGGEGRRRGFDPASAADPAAIAAEATAHLARRDFASAELASKLEERGYEAAAVAAVIAEFLDDRVLDDARYIENFVAAHVRRGQGPFRIRQELRGLGLPDELLKAALDAGTDWHELARHVRASKFGPDPPGDRAEGARQARFLQYRGFSTDHIRSALGRDPDP